MAGYIQGQDVNQCGFKFSSLDDLIDENSIVRVIDALVDTLDESLCLIVYSQTKPTARPPHDPVKLFKLYIYCYFEKIRSARNIEKECTRNVEVMWLVNALVPDHKCICNFQEDNKTAIKKAFCEFIKLCDALGLLGKGMVAWIVNRN